MLTLRQSHVGCTQGLLYDPSGMYHADKYFLLLNTNSSVTTEFHKIIKKNSDKGYLKKPSSSCLPNHINNDVCWLQVIPKLTCLKFGTKAEAVSRTFSKKFTQFYLSTNLHRTEVIAS